MEEILHKLISSLSDYLQGFLHPKWLAGFFPSTVWQLEISFSQSSLELASFPGLWFTCWCRRLATWKAHKTWEKTLENGPRCLESWTCWTCNSLCLHALDTTTCGQVRLFWRYCNWSLGIKTAESMKQVHQQVLQTEGGEYQQSLRSSKKNKQNLLMATNPTWTLELSFQN